MGYTVRVYGRKHYVSLWSRVCKEGEQPELLDLVVKVPPKSSEPAGDQKPSGLGCAPCLSASSFSPVVSVNSLLSPILHWPSCSVPLFWLSPRLEMHSFRFFPSSLLSTGFDSLSFFPGQ